MEIIVAVVITYFIVSMKKNLTRPYTLTSRVGGFGPHVVSSLATEPCIAF